MLRGEKRRGKAKIKGKSKETREVTLSHSVEG